MKFYDEFYTNIVLFYKTCLVKICVSNLVSLCYVLNRKNCEMMCPHPEKKNKKKHENSYNEMTENNRAGRLMF